MALKAKSPAIPGAELELPEELVPDEHTRAAADRERVLVTLRSTTPYTGFAAAVVVFLILSYSSTLGRLVLDPHAVTWLVVMHVLLALDTGSVRYALRSGFAARRLALVANLYCLSGILIGSSWASSMFVLIPSASPALDSVLATLMALILCGGTASLAADSMFSATFAFPLAVVAAVALFRVGDAPHAIIGVGFLMLSTHLVVAGRVTEQAMSRSFQLKILNENLRRRAEEQRMAAERARSDAERLRLLGDAAREDAERADRAKTRFIAATSHDLRQPLHALVQYIADLRALAAEPAVVARLQRVDEALSALMELMNAVLDFSRAAAGDLNPKLQTLDLEVLVRRLEAQLVPAASAKGLRLDVRSSGGLVISDEALLARVIGNILHNAVRYTDRGGVTLRTRRLPGSCRVVVADTGIGIAAEFRNSIFDDYFQVGNVERDRRKGLGLGLAIVRELAVLLKLKLKLKSRLGVGTVFMVEIPAAETELPVFSVARNVKHEAVSGALVLLVEDDPLVRDSTETTLRRFGCRVLSAGSAEEARSLLDSAEFLPQIIVSDLRLGGGVSGDSAALDLAWRVGRETESGTAPPVIVVTGDTQSWDRLEVDRKVFARLKKPVTPAVLYACMNEALLQILDGNSLEA